MRRFIYSYNNATKCVAGASLGLL